MYINNITDSEISFGYHGFRKNNNVGWLLRNTVRPSGHLMEIPYLGSPPILVLCLPIGLLFSTPCSGSTEFLGLSLPRVT
jgi:hypothetical protein